MPAIDTVVGRHQGKRGLAPFDPFAVQRRDKKLSWRTK